MPKGKMKLAKFTAALLTVSEKAANIARVMRSEKTLFDLLVQEKTGESKNKRFVQDFKTLGDVLVQETVRHDVAKQFADLANQIYGEESNKFTNTLGETVEVRVCPTHQETCQLLDTVLDGNSKAASLLANVVHQEITMATPSDLDAVEAEVDMNNVGIWIDPIDSTAQYIHGKDGSRAPGGIHSEGLQCVVVLIGAYDMTSGLPIVGVCNQPFSERNPSTGQWRGRCVWGVSYDCVQLCNVVAPKNQPEPQNATQPSVVISSSERDTVQHQLQDHFHLYYAPGAGYKVLCVIDRLVSAYLLTSGSTFKWDTCGPHAILRSLGGNIVDLGAVVEETRDGHFEDDSDFRAVLDKCQLHYSHPDAGERPCGEQWSNSRGIIAFVDKTVVFKLLKSLK